MKTTTQKPTGAVDRSGWMDVANSVPELKQALFENQMHFKYIVYVPTCTSSLLQRRVG
jgi:hypothetical protein